MTEHYIRPPLIAREPAPYWLGPLRFRIAAGLGLLLAAVLLFVVFQTVIGGVGEQDPGVNALCQLQVNEPSQAGQPSQVSGTVSRADVPPPGRCDRVSVPAS